MTFDYSLTSMLPFARAAIRNTSNFDIPQLVDLLFGELEKASVPGVMRAPQTSPRKHDITGFCPPQLQSGTIEVMFYLEHRGFILPEYSNFPTINRFKYWKTARGTEWANGAKPIPEDVKGYMWHLSSLAPFLDPIIRQYVEEGLGSFHREMFFSAAVMLGAAITPVGGSDKVPTFVALIGSQKNLNIATLIDFQKSDAQTIENLYKRKLLTKSHVLTFVDFTKKTESDIEDMFDEDFYLGLVNDEFAGALGAKITRGNLTSRAPRILVRLEEYFASNPLKGGVQFNHYRPARFLAERVSTLSIPNDTLDRFEAAFKSLNALL